MNLLIAALIIISQAYSQSICDSTFSNGCSSILLSQGFCVDNLGQCLPSGSCATNEYDSTCATHAGLGGICDMITVFCQTTLTCTNNVCVANALPGGYCDQITTFCGTGYSCVTNLCVSNSAPTSAPSVPAQFCDNISVFCPFGQICNLGACITTAASTTAATTTKARVVVTQVPSGPNDPTNLVTLDPNYGAYTTIPLVLGATPAYNFVIDGAGQKPTFQVYTQHGNTAQTDAMTSVGGPGGIAAMIVGFLMLISLVVVYAYQRRVMIRAKKDAEIAKMASDKAKKHLGIAATPKVQGMMDGKGTPKKASSTPKINKKQSAGLQKAQDLAKSSGGWVCIHCTLVNAKDVKLCGGCQTVASI